METNRNPAGLMKRPIARKDVAALEKERRRLIDFSALKMGAERAEELERGVISETDMRECDPLHAVNSTRFIADRQIYEQVIQEAVPSAQRFLWLATADLKDLHVNRGKRMVPFLAVLSELITNGVAVRLLHAKEPGPLFRRDFDRYPGLLPGTAGQDAGGFVGPWNVNQPPAWSHRGRNAGLTNRDEGSRIRGISDKVPLVERAEREPE